MYNEILEKLKNFPQFRERRFRVKYLSILALRSCGLEDKKQTPLTLEELAEFAQSYTSYDRIWRLVLKENKDLQGEDYEDKVEVEQEKMLSLGFSPNYLQDNKKLKTL